MSRYVLILSIGPVQSFIVEARRTLDLYSGSQLLAQVARTAAQTILQYDGELIYPTKESLDSQIADTPNKLVALVIDPVQVAGKVHQAVKQRWEAFARDALAKLAAPNDPLLQRIWQRQRDHHLEFYWAAAELTDNYQAAYQLADQGLAARKQTRTFLACEEAGAKDSLSGSRSALMAQGYDDADDYWARLRQHKPGSHLQEGELLDTIGAMKRFTFEGKKEGKFPSISTVASAPFARACHTAGLLAGFIDVLETFNRPGEELNLSGWPEAVVEDFKHWTARNCFHQVGDFGTGFNYDGDLLYMETYTPEHLKDSYSCLPDNVQPIIGTMTAALRDLYEAAKKVKPNRPNPYYAILQMDGDRMGQHISLCHGQADHQKLSGDLHLFTQQVRQLVIAEHGYLVYAGGDDVLALFPAEHVLTAANKLAQAYRDQFQNWHQQDNGVPFPFTMSAGIAFAHHTSPLDVALEAVRQAEKQAKSKYGRNALSVVVLRRSGETLQVGGKWQVERAGQLELNTVDNVYKLIDYFQNDRLSSRFAYSVFSEAPVVTTLSDKDGRAFTLRRLIKRHRNQKTFRDEDEKELIGVWTAWANAHDVWLPPASEAGDKDTPPAESHQLHNQGFYELARWFVLARWLAQGGEE